MKKKLLFLALLVILLTVLLPSAALAWNQDTHRQINAQAAIHFVNTFGKLPKYQNAQPFNSRLCQGVGVVGSSFERLDHRTEICAHYPLQWLVLGGDWADEPNLYMSLRHFYDPLQLSGFAYLTDQWYGHGTLYSSPETDLKSWSINHPDNPFCFQKALEYYKKALEISEQGTPQPFYQKAFAAGQFRLRGFVPSTLDEEREFYLALAFRALGESLHALADMTQPAHVRNDSHPLYEPVEDHVWGKTAQKLADLPIDSNYREIVPAADNPSSMLPAQLFQEIAELTNLSFISADTIYDSALGVQPDNGEKPYQSPQLADFRLELHKVRNVDIRTWYASFLDGKLQVPMAQDKLTTYLVNQSYPGKKIDNDIHIPPSFAYEQGKVLIPAAIHAGAAYINLFYPTLKLDHTVTTTADQPADGILSIAVESSLIHANVDPAWLDAGLSIRYSGPARLRIIQQGKLVRTIRLNYTQGKLSHIENQDQELVEKPLVLYFRERRQARLNTDQAYYELEAGQSAEIELQAGDRTFRKTVYSAGEFNPSVYLDSDDYEGAAGEPIEMIATPSDLGSYRFVWDYGDGQNETVEGPVSSVNHIYEANGTYTVRVLLKDLQGKALNQATAEVTVKDMAPTAEPSDYEYPKPDGGNLANIHATDHPDEILKRLFGWEDMVDYSKLERKEHHGSIYYVDQHDQYAGWEEVWSEDGKYLTKMYYHLGENEGITVIYRGQPNPNIWWIEIADRQYKIRIQFQSDEDGSDQVELINYSSEGNNYIDQFGYHQNGTLKVRQHMLNWVYQGPFTVYYENGQIQQEGSRVDNLFHGLIRNYNPDGSLKSEIEYVNGEPVKK